jgi:3-methyladenine DNA glycosylase/8-oxoguanine DNA glycosylase
VAVGAALGLATNIIPRFGYRPVLVTGLLLSLAGTLLFTRITADGSYLTQVLPASVVFALGSGLCLPTLGNAAVHQVTGKDAGLASGIQQALQQIGGAVGLAALVSLALRSAEDAVRTGTDPLVAITDGYVLALRVGAGVLVAAVVLAATLLRPAWAGVRRLLPSRTEVGLLRLPLDGTDLDGSLATYAMLPRDPTVRLRPGRFERATVTPDGAATLVATWDADAVEVRTTGEGAAWLLDRAAAALGLTDDARGFAPEQQPLRDLWRRHRGDRIPRSGTLWHDLAWFVVQQRVRRDDADAQWWRLVQAYGTPAPGAEALRTPPAPSTVARLAYSQLHGLGLERRRAQTLVEAARVVTRLEHLVDGPCAEAEGHVRRVPGIGPWTASCLGTHTWGDADRVVEGDDGIPSLVAWVLAREPRADDSRMLALLEPFRPHRYRVVRLAFRSGLRPPRLGPRRQGQDIRRR